jgi:hypothetical protein
MLAAATEPAAEAAAVIWWAGRRDCVDDQVERPELRRRDVQRFAELPAIGGVGANRDRPGLLERIEVPRTEDDRGAGMLS